MTSKVSLPKKKDWKPGTDQIGLFMRTAQGTTINMTVNQATPELCALFSQMVSAAGRPRGQSPERTFDEWLKIWNERYDARESARSATAGAAEPTATPR